MGAAMQLCAVTSYLTANVAAIPLLWILPLAVYLITLILAFQFPRLLPWRYHRALSGRACWPVSVICSPGQRVCARCALAMIFFLVEVFFCLPLLPFARPKRYAPNAASEVHTLLSPLCRRAGAGLVPHRHCLAAHLFLQYDLDLHSFL